MASIWDTFRNDHFVGLCPWSWIQFESSESPGPVPFLGGVAPSVVASHHEVHQHLSGAIDMAISDVFAGRSSGNDPALRTRLENAYAEVVHSRPHWREHIRCRREPDGTFHWEFPLDAAQSATIEYSGLRVFNAATRQVIPFGFDRLMASVAATRVAVCPCATNSRAWE